MPRPPLPMAERAATVGLTLLAVIFPLVAVQALFLPDTLVTPVGISLTEASAYAEVRAAYGGCFLALAMIFSVMSAVSYFANFMGAIAETKTHGDESAPPGGE